MNFCLQVRSRSVCSERRSVALATTELWNDIIPISSLSAFGNHDFGCSTVSRFRYQSSSERDLHSARNKKYSRSTQGANSCLRNHICLFRPALGCNHRALGRHHSWTSPSQSVFLRKVIRIDKNVSYSEAPSSLSELIATDM